MKRFWGLTVVLILLNPAFAQEPAFPPAHDFTSPTPEAAAHKEICNFCHIPHTTQKIESLWSTLELITEPQADKVLKKLKPSPLAPGSLNCLACHDGVLAPNPWKKETFDSPEIQGVLVFSEPPMGRLAEFPPMADFPLRHYEHPVGVKTTFAQSKTGWLGPPPADFPGKLSQDGYTQCASCHNPHQDAFKPFLAASNQGGRLCLNCHRMNP